MCIFVMAGPIDLKFSGPIPGTRGLPARGLLEMCMIHFKRGAIFSFGKMTTSIFVFKPYLNLGKGFLLTPQHLNVSYFFNQSELFSMQSCYMQTPRSNIGVNFDPKTI